MAVVAVLSAPVGWGGPSEYLGDHCMAPVALMVVRRVERRVTAAVAAC